MAGLIIGTNGPEFIWGYEGDDIIWGLGGDDVILPGTGNNVIDGGDGNDTIDYTNYVAPWYANLNGVDVDLAAGTAHKQNHSLNPNSDPDANQTDIFVNIENVAGSNYNDHLFGDGGWNKLYGWDGNDELHGRGGYDHLEGMDGNDLLDGGEGPDVLDGGDGIDTAYYGSAPSAVNVSLESGKGYWGDSAGDTLSNIENLTGSNFDDQLLGDGNNNVLDGGDGNDYLKGGGGADKLYGGPGNDTAAYGDSNVGVYVSLHSGAAVNGTATGDSFSSIENLTGSYHGDVLEGDGYVNKLQGMDGDDVLQGYGSADTIDGGDGIDTAIYGGSSAGVTILLNNLGTGVGSGGDAQGDTLISIENLRGSNYADTLMGNNDANVLEGWGGNDKLKGSGGADTLIGGLGADTMYGGPGADKFVLEALGDTGVKSGSMDIIMDFNLADQDKIDVHSIDANATLPGNQAFTFIEDDAFSAAGQIRYSNNGVDTFIELNTDNILVPDAVIQISGLHTVDASWFGTL